MFVEYHITDKCNVKCASCIHYCSLVDNNVQHKSLDQIRSDLYLLHKIKNVFDELHILGGEPLLSSNLIDCINLSRRLFDNYRILLSTNGTIEFSEDLLNCIKINNIEISLSEYPFKDNYKDHYNNLKSIFDKYHIIYTSYVYNTFQVKQLANTYINYNKDQIVNCRMRCCNQLVNGKLYMCPQIAYFKYFDNYFKNIHNMYSSNINKKDFLDLNEVINDQEVYDFIKNSIPTLCNYCNECNRFVNNNMVVDTWHRSNKDIKEWIT